MPPKPAAGKGKKLPTWAYFAAAGIGILLVILFTRKSGASDGTTVPVTTQTPSDTTTQGQGDMSAFFDGLAAIISAHGGADNPPPAGGGGGGCKALGETCSGGLPGGTDDCCDLISNHCGHKRSNGVVTGYVCKPREKGSLHIPHPATTV